jgi:hypothetical protein
MRFRSQLCGDSGLFADAKLRSRWATTVIEGALSDLLREVMPRLLRRLEIVAFRPNSKTSFYSDLIRRWPFRGPRRAVMFQVEDSMVGQSMQLEWELLHFPMDPTGYHAVAETYGDIRVIIDGNEFVRLDDVLILEFAAYANQWLSDTNRELQSPFYYRSMDEEDEPLLALNPIDKTTYTATSCWSIWESRSLSKEEVTNALMEFLANLLQYLSQRNFSLQSAFDTLKIA